MWNESLNRDGHQLHQYQQNEQSPLILTEITEHKTNTMTYDVGNPSPVLGQAQECGRVKSVNGIPNLLLTTGSPTAIYLKHGQQIICIDV